MVAQFPVYIVERSCKSNWFMRVLDQNRMQQLFGSFSEQRENSNDMFFRLRAKLRQRRTGSRTAQRLYFLIVIITRKYKKASTWAPCFISAFTFLSKLPITCFSTKLAILSSFFSRHKARHLPSTTKPAACYFLLRNTATFCFAIPRRSYFLFRNTATFWLYGDLQPVLPACSGAGRPLRYQLRGAAGRPLLWGAAGRPLRSCSGGINAEPLRSQRGRPLRSCSGRKATS